MVAFDLTPSDRYSLGFSFYLLPLGCEFAFEASGSVVGLVRAIEVGRDGVLARDSDFSSEVESVEIQSQVLRYLSSSRVSDMADSLKDKRFDMIICAWLLPVAGRLD